MLFVRYSQLTLSAHRKDLHLESIDDTADHLTRPCVPVRTTLSQSAKSHYRTQALSTDSAKIQLYVKDHSNPSITCESMKRSNANYHLC